MPLSNQAICGGLIGLALFAVGLVKWLRDRQSTDPEEPPSRPTPIAAPKSGAAGTA